ncbi:ankyrin repeat domain-containing protein 39-like [Dendronephthya gigantea]|uniref:ankyrin repeat domain-containing protein 39-like n=1 Tax=Dendronephthya gigantea TaxID=151771 RepID=UPI00106BBA8C|nr:ankyrin repeat domain-containing protein 39-like [Dendronephthya gigantea]
MGTGRFLGLEMSTNISGMHHDHGSTCQCTASSTPYSQNMDEMDFTRGIWSAALNGEVDQVQKYLDRKCSADILDSAGYTALHYAARNGHLNVCKILLDYGANPNSLTRAGKASPLHRAAYSGHSNIVKTLIEHGGKLDLADVDGQTALHKAAQKSHIEIIQHLLKHKPSLSLVKDNLKKLPIDYVPETNRDLQLLLEPS